jgi:hypothetical protein
MNMNDMYKHAKAGVDYLCLYWENEGPNKYGQDIAKERLKECRQERDALIEFKRNGFKE